MGIRGIIEGCLGDLSSNLLFKQLGRAMLAAVGRPQETARGLRLALWTGFYKWGFRV